MNLKFNKKTVIWIVVAALVVLAITLGLVFGLKGSSSESGARIVSAVVSNGIGCANVGGEMLDDGGSAVDAAIAILLCEGVMLPQSLGIGGGFVATIYTRRTRSVETVIARESAPAAAHKDMFVNETEVTGARAGAVPGEILGYWEMHEKYGRLPWKRLFEPTIKLAKEGHVVSKYLASAIQSKLPQIQKEPSMSEVFLKPDGTPYVEGDYMKRTVLGETLQRIADNGAKEIYGGGQTGKMFVEDIQALGGIITEEDLRNYKVSWENGNHISANVTGGYTLYTTPLPSSGVLLAFILNVINEMYTNDSRVYWQRIIETFKHAYGQRSNLGDLANERDHADTIQRTLNNLLDDDFVHSVRKLIHDDKTFKNVSYYGANFTVEADNGTANVNVIDSSGDAISITSTINNYFGCKVRSTRTGIILNDEMDDFSTPGVLNSFGVPASPSNYIHPNKRPMSSMSPAVIIDQKGDVRMLVGAAGGTKITTSVAETIIKYLILKEPIETAINDGRMHHQLLPMSIDAEQEVNKDLIEYLRGIGHEINLLAQGTGFAAVTAIGARDNLFEPLYDRRRIGSTSLQHDRNKMIH